MSGTTPFNLRDAGLERRLAAFAATWQRRRATLWSLTTQRWHPGATVTPDLRRAFEVSMPVSDYLGDLARLARHCLPHPSWVPQPLRLRYAHTRPLVAPGGPASLPDLWRSLPPDLAGAVRLSPEKLVRLLCALADPPRFGTGPDRYPAQTKRTRAYLTARSGNACAILDLGCGVGDGLLKTVALRDNLGVGGNALGITREPLEAWMAATGRRPHAPAREAQARQLVDRVRRVRVLPGDLRRVPAHGPFDLVLCNGVVGGPLLADDASLHQLLSECKRLLAEHGLLLLANCFHDGARRGVERFLDMAAARPGWSIQGTWQDAALTRPQ